MLKDPTTTVLEAIVWQIMLKALETGDAVRMNFLLDRIIGKVVDRLEIRAVPIMIGRYGTEEVITLETKQIE